MELFEVLATIGGLIFGAWILYDTGYEDGRRRGRYEERTRQSQTGRHRR